MRELNKIHKLDKKELNRIEFAGCRESDQYLDSEVSAIISQNLDLFTIDKKFEVKALIIESK